MYQFSDIKYYNTLKTNKKINDVLRNPKDKIEYTYDLGDSWNHIIELLKTVPRSPTKEYPICTGGKKSFPIEDVPEDYSVTDDPDFDSEYFNKEELNEKIRAYQERQEARRQAGQSGTDDENDLIFDFSLQSDDW